MFLDTRILHWLSTERYMNEKKISFYVATLNKAAIVAPFNALNFNKYLQ